MKKKNPVDAALDAAFIRLGCGVQVNIMNLGPLFADARKMVQDVMNEKKDSIPSHALISMAMNSAIAKYRE